MRVYVRRHEKGCVETIDLIRACEDASGMNLTGFFDQWIMSPGHPEIEGSISWEEDEKRVKVAVKQVQKLENGTPVFRIPVRVESTLDDGKIVGETFQMDQQDQTFYVSVPRKPVAVALDPEQAVLGTWKVGRPIEWLEAALLGKHRHPRVAARVDAVYEISNKPSYQGETILGKVLLSDRFWGVQAHAAQALGRIRSPHALELLLAAVKVAHPKARRAVVQALGSFQTPQTVAALRKIVVGGDPSYFVEASAAAALGRTGRSSVVADLRKAMRKHSWHDLIATHAADGLAATRDESVVDDLLALALDRRRYWNCRLTAMRALADLGAARPALAPRIAEELTRFLEDPDFLICSRVTEPIVALGHEAGVAALRRAAAATPDPRLAQTYLLATEELSTQRKRGEDVDRLRDELEKMRSETKELREEIQKLNGTAAPNGKRPPRGGGRRRK
jgi:aminopeptidase N